MTTPYAYQIKGVRQMHRLGGRVLLGDDPGLGKSFQSLLYGLRHPKARPILVICPAHLKWNWHHEVLIHTNYNAEVLEGTRPPLGHSQILFPYQVVIINYDIMPHWVGFLQRVLRPQMVVIDECQYISNRRAKRTKAVRHICKGVPHILALSGTPFENNPEQLWSICNLLQPKIFPSYYPFCMRYCAPKRNAFGGWDFRGASRLDELHEKLINNLMVRRRRVDVLSDLPPKQRIVQHLTLTDRREYDQAMSDFVSWISQQHPGKIRQALKVQGLAKIGYVRRLLAKLKLRAAREWILSHLEGTQEKLIVFAIHRAVVGQLHAYFKNRSVVVDGSIKGKDRQRAFRKFLTDKKTDIFIGNIQAAGTGWSGKGVSDTAFVEMDWKPGAHIQAEDRTEGVGRGIEGKHSRAYYLIAHNTIEERHFDLLVRKQKNINAVMDDGMGEDFSIYNDIVKEILNQRR